MTPEQMDAEANAFAMELLMPEFLLRPELEKIGGIDIENETAVRKLATKFKVSTQVMTLRIGQLLVDDLASGGG